MGRPAGDRLRFLELAVSATAGQPDFQEPESITNPPPGQNERQACELLLRAG
ncbi:hypothetical protein [Micromonospora costi]|nr:hypothetical protein [Micromonospora costi]